MIFFAGSVLEEVIATRWQRLPVETRAAVQSALQSIVQDRLLSFTSFARNKVVDAFIRMVERTWPAEFPGFLDWIAMLLHNPATTEISAHIVEAFIVNCTRKTGRCLLLVSRRRELEALVVW